MKTTICIWVDRRKTIVASLRPPESVDEQALQTTIEEIFSDVEKRPDEIPRGRSGFHT